MSKIRHRLRGRKIVKHVFYSVFFSLMAAPAYAEVCDKERPRWDPASGPLSQFREAYFSFSSFLGLWLIAFIVVVFLSQKRWVPVLYSPLLISIAALVAEWYWLSDTPDGVAEIARAGKAVSPCPHQRDPRLGRSGLEREGHAAALRRVTFGRPTPRHVPV